MFVYSEAPVLGTPREPGKVSCMERCPHFSGVYIFMLKKPYLGHSKVSLLQRCPYFRGVL